MSTFAVEEIEAIRGKQTFYKLLVDGKAPIDEFEEELLGVIEIVYYEDKGRNIKE